jgi:uncharacterized membrane protein
MSSANPIISSLLTNEKYKDNKKINIFLTISLFIPLIYNICFCILCYAHIKKWEKSDKPRTVTCNFGFYINIVTIILYLLCIIWILFLKGRLLVTLNLIFLYKFI